MNKDNKVLNYIKSKVESGFNEKNPSHFSLICKNICNLTDKAQGYEVEKYLECITGFEQIAEDGISIEKVGHKGDLKVLYGDKEYFPNAKSTMLGTGALWLKDPNQMGAKTIKVFDASRTPNFSLPKKLKQIDNDLIIIHFAWHSIQLKGCISVTSLQEISAYCDVKVIDLFRANKNDEGKPQHWSISTKDLYNTARYHDRILPFKVTKKEAKSFLTKHKGFNKPSLVGLMKDE